jgi:hypothetical protein
MSDLRPEPSAAAPLHPSADTLEKALQLAAKLRSEAEGHRQAHPGGSMSGVCFQAAAEIEKLVGDLETLHVERDLAEEFEPESHVTPEQIARMVQRLSTARDAAERRVAELERQIREHRCGLPPSISEALNSGDGSYKP